jgi:UDP-N-acetylmuramate--alanine ligase
MDELLAAIGHPEARHMADLGAIADWLAPRLAPGDVLLTLGAGDGDRVGEQVLARLAKRGDR